MFKLPPGERNVGTGDTDPSLGIDGWINLVCNVRASEAGTSVVERSARDAQGCLVADERDAILGDGQLLSIGALFDNDSVSWMSIIDSLLDGLPACGRDRDGFGGSETKEDERDCCSREPHAATLCW